MALQQLDLSHDVHDTTEEVHVFHRQAEGLSLPQAEASRNVHQGLVAIWQGCANGRDLAD
jgi:hypothetical protein